MAGQLYCKYHTMFDQTLTSTRTDILGPDFSKYYVEGFNFLSSISNLAFSVFTITSIRAFNYIL